MRFFMAALGLQLRRLVRKPAFLACLALVPLLVLVLGVFVPQNAPANPILVGVLLPGGSTAANDMWASLEDYSDDQVQFVRAESRAQLDEMVAARAWECGYAAAEDLDARIEEESFTRLFTRVVSTSTTTAELIDWVVAASLLDVCAPQLALNYLEAGGGLTEDSLAAAKEGISAAFGGAQLMRLDTVTVNSGSGGGGRGSGGQNAIDTPALEEATPSAGAALARGAVALLLLLFAMLCAVLFAQDQTTGFFARLWPLASPAKLFLPSCAACMGLCGLAGGLGLGLAGLFYPAFFGPLPREAGLLLLYILCLGAFSLLCAAIFAGRGRLVTVLPFVMIAALLFSPVFVDLTAYIPGGDAITLLLPPAAYLKAAAGQRAAAAALAVSFGAYLAAGLGILLLRRRRSVL